MLFCKETGDSQRTVETLREQLLHLLRTDEAFRSEAERVVAADLRREMEAFKQQQKRELYELRQRVIVLQNQLRDGR